MGLYYDGTVGYGLAVVANEDVYTTIREFCEEFSDDNGVSLNFDDNEYVYMDGFTINNALQFNYVGYESGIEPHLVVLDLAGSVYLEKDDLAPTFLPAPSPAAEKLLNILAQRLGTGLGFLAYSTYA
jgi:hypothetical protein